MTIKAFKTALLNIQPLRTLFLQETNFQVRYNACHERGWSDSYLLSADGINIGYGSVKGKDKLTDRDAVFEFYIIAAFREISGVAFAELLKTSGATFIECQSNDFLLSSMLYEFGENINADVFLFDDHVNTEHNIPGIIFRRRLESESTFDHKFEPVGEYVLEKNKEIVATAGFMLYYNIPFADLYMEVKEDHRKQGLGSYLVQEVKKECYLSGRVPAARTSINNIGSKNTLLKAGMKICGFMLTGEVRKELRG